MHIAPALLLAKSSFASHLEHFPKSCQGLQGWGHIRFADAKTTEVQLRGKMTYFKWPGDLRLEGNLERLSLETRSPGPLGSPGGYTRTLPALPLH